MSWLVGLMQEDNEINISGSNIDIFFLRNIDELQKNNYNNITLDEKRWMLLGILYDKQKLNCRKIFSYANIIINSMLELKFIESWRTDILHVHYLYTYEYLYHAYKEYDDYLKHHKNKNKNDDPVFKSYKKEYKRIRALIK